MKTNNTGKTCSNQEYVNLTPPPPSKLNTVWVIGLAAFFIISLSFIFSACDNMIGLGDKVNTEKPVISIPDDGTAAGSFIKGDGRQWLSIEQPFGIDKVFVTLTYFDKADKQEKTKRIDAVKDEKTGLWYYDLDTTDIMDGTISYTVTAIDVSGNTTTSTEIILTVKNTPPQFEMTIPLVAGINFDTINFNNSAQFQKINRSNSIMGIASDLYGIEEGYPQIMIWQVNENGQPWDKETNTPVTLASDASQPSNSQKWGTWRVMYDNANKPLASKGSKALQVRWPMVKLVQNSGNWVLPTDLSSITFEDYHPTGTYYFKVKVKDLFGITNIYPYRIDNELGPDGTSIPPEEHPNKFVGIEVIQTTGPVFSPQGDFNKYYNYSVPFTGNVTGGLDFSYNIMSPNGMDISGKVYAQIGLINADLYDLTDNSYVEVSNIIKTGEYLNCKISIPINKIHGHDMASYSSDEYYLHVYAEDNQGNKNTTSRAIILDKQVPVIGFIEPFGLEDQSSFTIQGNDQFTVSGSLPELYSTIIFRGTTNDDQKVVKMYYALGKNEATRAVRIYNPNSITNDGWTDTRLDTTLPIQNHPSQASINSRWSGSLTSWSWRFEDIAELIRIPAQADTNGNYFVKPHGVDGVANNLWELPISFKLVDVSGNVNYINVSVVIDPDKDRPNVGINSHLPIKGTNSSTGLPNPTTNFTSIDSRTLVGGEVRLSGIADDNEYIYDVLVKVTAQYDNDCFQSYPENNNFTGIANPSHVITTKDDSSKYLNPSLSGNSTYQNQYKGFESVTLLGNKSSKVSWEFYLNSDKTLTAQGKLRRVWIELFAVDSSIYSTGAPKYIRLNQPVTRVELVFSSEVPIIEEESIIRYSAGMGIINNSTPVLKPYEYGTTVSGFIIYRAKVTANTPIDTIEVGGDGVDFKNYSGDSSTYTDEYTPWTVPIGIDKKGYYLYIPLNTNSDGNRSFLDGKFRHKAGQYNINLRIRDTSNPAYMIQPIRNLKIDNYHPSAKYTGNINVVGEYTLSGFAWDIGTSDIIVQKLDKVVVHLAKPGTENGGYGRPVNLQTGAILSTLTSDWVTNQRVLEGRVTVEPTPYAANPVTSTVIEQGNEYTLPFFPNISSSNVTTAAGVVVNGVGNLGDNIVVNGETKTRYYQYFDADPMKKEWTLRFNDTSMFADGEYEARFAVYDDAGNITFYRQRIMIANKFPVIQRVWVGTDISGNGLISNFTNASNPGEFFDYDLTNNFRIRNYNFSLRVEKKTGTGNAGGANFNYRVSYAQRTQMTLSSENNITVGRVYTIHDPNSITPNEWINLGVLEKPALNDYRGVTFVAMNTYSGDGNAEIYSYNDVGTAATTQRTANSAADAIDIVGNISGGFRQGAFYGTHAVNGPFGNPASTTLINDSIKQTDGTILPADQKKRFFTVKVWDNTISGGAENRQLAYAKVLELDIDNFDIQRPKISINPFHWNDASDNSLYDNSREYGHIELENDLPASFNTVSTATSGVNDKDPKVSGKVSFRGVSSDNNVIGEIYLRFSKHTNRQSVTITEGGTGNDYTYYRAASYNGAAWSTENRLNLSHDDTNNIAGANGSNGWRFVIEEGGEPTMDGHTVKWRIDFDSSFVTSIANTDVILSVLALDIASTPNRSQTTDPNNWTNTQAAARQTTAANPTEHYKFDVVPYVRDVFTPLSRAFRAEPSAFSRSAKGYYPVPESRSANEFIEIKGFNFNGATAGSVTVSGTALNGIATATASNTDSASFNKNVSSNRNTHIVARIDNDGTVDNANSIVSGALLVAVNGFSSLNNTNNNNAEYNKEPNNLNNNILTDDRNIYVWNTGLIRTETAAETPMRNPFMRMDAAANWYLSYGGSATSSGSLYVVKNNTRTALQTDTNRFLNTSVAFDNNGDYYVAASNQTAGTDRTFSVYARAATSATNPNNGSNHRRILTLDGNPDRVKIPRIAVRSTLATGTATTAAAARVFLSYYDADKNDNTVFFHYGLIGGTLSTTAGFGGNFPNGATAANYRLSATAPFTDIHYYNANASTSAATLGNFAQRVADNNTNHKGSQYTAVGGFANGLPVVAWYDRVNTNLIFSYGNAAPTTTTLADTTSWVATTTAQWQANATIVKEFVGTHVDMTVDADDGVHLAYYDVFNGGLWYTYIPATGTGTAKRPNVSARQTVRVDTYLSAGTKLMINTRLQNSKHIPYISYFHASFAETRNCVRIAWLSEATNYPATVPEGMDGNNRFTGNWEVMTVPTDRVPASDQFICHGVPTSGNLNNRLPTSLLLTSSLANTVFLGYLTDANYEGAILKASIY